MADDTEVKRYLALVAYLAKLCIDLTQIFKYSVDIIVVIEVGSLVQDVYTAEKPWELTKGACHLAASQTVEKVVEHRVILSRDKSSYFFLDAVIGTELVHKLLEIADMSYLKSEIAAVKACKCFSSGREDFKVAFFYHLAAEKLDTGLYDLVGPALEQGVVLINALVIEQSQRELCVFKTCRSEPCDRYSGIGTHNDDPALRVHELIHTFLSEMSCTGAEQVIELNAGSNNFAVSQAAEKRIELLLCLTPCKTLIKQKIPRSLGGYQIISFHVLHSFNLM